MGGRRVKHLVQHFVVEGYSFFFFTFSCFPAKHHPNVMMWTLRSSLPVILTSFTFYTLPHNAINMLVFLSILKECPYGLVFIVSFCL